MMRFIFVGICFWSVTSFAQSSGDERICRNFNANPIVVALQPSGHQLVLCEFSGSFIEARTLENSANGNYFRTWAVDSYKNNVYPQHSCERDNAWVVRAIDGHGRTLNLCEFGDRSYMEFTTYRWGPRTNNIRMDFALGIY